MIISRNRFIPSEHSTTWTLFGCTALTSTDGLTDNRAASESRFTITDANSFSIATSISGSVWGQYFADGLVVGVIGLSLPYGAYAYLSLSNPSTGIENYLSTIKTLPDGSNALWFYANNPLNGVINAFSYTVKIFFGDNIHNVTADSTFDVGEFWIGDATSYPIKPTLRLKSQNDSSVRRSTNGQPWPLLRRSYRVVGVDLTPKDYDTVYGTDALSWTNLRGSLDGAEPCVAIPAYLDSNGNLDQTIVTQQALSGWCSNRGEIVRQSNSKLHNLSLEFTEYPPSTV